MADQQKVTIAIPEGYSSLERQAIAEEILIRITERTREENRDKNGRGFAGYSKAYRDSLEYSIAGKTGAVDLTLSGEMLDALKILNESKGQITIGYDAGDSINGKVEGNRLGTYGKPYQVGPKRDFLGITKKEMTEILKNYPLNDVTKRSESFAQVLESDRISSNILSRIFLDNPGAL